ncbi:MAG TPA: anhydro-N-acetylmuramic acid kinase [Paracoccus sp. (in: a-proteobacteria)]|uniref:anhydro-N-acetylmuramic acid kinase n=1 Tax=uncultured Paracoccus sp. TaxID=189685 RepID=UPI002602F775|nr:anhydro-N-acetylmuramic acid kinase [uncultured Paracoccus sp.]HMQ42070.1 anhydro-N-acetylmuramic acid kinase [Paracoccus sp. (in: a-proteobacteria)]HMR35803.1 anhydro-N-acetylmuramic acid kinase [Paracoccus sp. (in: a-proteobacteria)]
MQPAWAIGLMTGTVLDGFIDIAMLRTDGETIAEFGPWELAPYPTDIRDLLRRTFDAARDWNFTGLEPAIFREAEIALTEAQSEAVNRFVAAHGFAARDIAAVGFHGQTVLHVAPKHGRRGHTRQLGDGAIMAERTGIDVVHDFRSADVEAGGQGAPLSAIYHRAMLARIGAGPDTVMLNLGGVANITCFDGQEMMAFDTGPANAPVNDWIRARTGAEMDFDGRIAARGCVDEARLAQLLEHPFLSAPFPKSLDRFDFPANMADGLGLEDGAATLTAFTAGAVGKALDLLPVRARRLVVCGGGRKNPHMMAELARRTGTEITLAEAAGLRGDAVEAECFAFLAMRAMRGLPISFPLTTGVPAPQTGGRIARHETGQG